MAPVSVRSYSTLVGAVLVANPRPLSPNGVGATESLSLIFLAVRFFDLELSTLLYHLPSSTSARLRMLHRSAVIRSSLRLHQETQMLGFIAAWRMHSFLRPSRSLTLLPPSHLATSSSSDATAWNVGHKLSSPRLRGVQSIVSKSRLHLTMRRLQANPHG